MKLTQALFNSKGQNKFEADKAEFEAKYTVSEVELGHGSFAEVRKGFNLETKEVVAIKIMHKKDMTKSDLKSLRKEIGILRKVNHRHIVRLYDSYETEAEIIIVMEFIGGGEMFKRIIDRTHKFTEDDIRKIIYQVTSALKHCNERGISHRDLKPQNILYTSPENGNDLKLVDFNLGFNTDPDSLSTRVMQTQCGTPNYVAPEVLSGKGYGTSCDVWSLGIIVFIVTSGGYMPFSHRDTQMLLKLILKGEWSFKPEAAWRDVSPGLKDLISGMIQKRISKRFSFDDILNHPWMAENDLVDRAIDVSNFEANLKRKFADVVAVMNAAHAFGEMMGPEDMIEDTPSFTTLTNL